MRSGLRLTLAFLALAARVAPEEPTVTAALIGDGGKGRRTSGHSPGRSSTVDPRRSSSSATTSTATGPRGT